MAEERVSLDLEHTDSYIRRTEKGIVDLETPEVYVKRVKAAIRWSKARAANWVALILVSGVVASLPLYVLVVCWSSNDISHDVDAVFGKWYDVVAPLVGAMIGALFGMTIASRQREEVD